MKTIPRAVLDVICSLIALAAAALLGSCGARTTHSERDAASADVAQPDTFTSLDGAVLIERDAPTAEVQPTSRIEPSAAFAELAGSYGAKASKVTGSSTMAFDNDAPYNFVVASSGSVTITTKTGTDTYDWASHGKSITRNSSNQVTVVEFEDSGKRILSITYHPSGGIFDVAGVVVEPFGRWYLTAIAKQ